jgi:hypothetical protein
MDDLAGDIVYCRGRRIEWHSLNWHSAIANRAQHQANLDGLEFADPFRPRSAIRIHDELILFNLQCRNPPVHTNNPYRRTQKRSIMRREAV